MKCKVLKPFPFAPDGVNTEMTEEGAVIEIPDDLVPGLEAAELIAPGGEGGKLETAVEGSLEMTQDTIENARADYQIEFGKSPPKNWGIEAIRHKIAEKDD